MIGFPNAKINLGLHVRNKRSDGFHNIESVFYPLPLCDVLEIGKSPSGVTTMKCTGLEIPPDTDGKEDNIIMRLISLLQAEFNLPPLYIHLHKVIPLGAGLGGGSSDCAFALQMINRICKMGLSFDRRLQIVTQLGSDCAFFLNNEPALASGRGETLTPVHLNLKGYHIVLIKPGVHINTALAYSWVNPNEEAAPLRETILKSPAAWKHLLVNDFEVPVFQRYPEIKQLKEMLYEAGALYAAMSGSGSAVFGIFEHEPENLDVPDAYFQWRCML